VTGYAEQANTFPKASRHRAESFREGDLAAVLLDMDGTLIEHTRDIHDLCRETFASFEEELAPVTQESFWETFWPMNRDMWYMMVDGVLSGDVARLYFFVNTLRALKADERLAAPMLEDWEGRIIAATRLFNDVIPTIERLRSVGLRLGIVTNGYTAMQSRKIDHHGLAALMDFVLISEEVGVHKPEKAIFDQALGKAETTAEQSLFVGDTPSVDIDGARKAGLHAVLMDPRDKWSELEGGVPRIRRLGELPPLVGLPETKRA
jgi:putative hydrolase of the HAD superfamily